MSDVVGDIHRRPRAVAGEVATSDWGDAGWSHDVPQSHPYMGGKSTVQRVKSPEWMDFRSIGL